MSQKNRSDLIAEMIDVGGVNPSHTNAVGQSALHIASLWGHHESVQVLVEKGANVNAQNNMTGATPLHMMAQSHKATMSQRKRVAEILIAHGAKVDLADNFGTSPLETFMNTLGDGKEDPEVNEIIVKLQPKRPEIHDALAERDVGRVQQLLEQNETFSNMTFQGESPVEIIVDELVRLVQSNSDEGDENHEASTSLLQLLQLVLQHHGNPNGTESTTEAAALTGNVKDPPLYKLISTLRDCFNQQHLSYSSVLEKAIDLLVHAQVTVTSETVQLLHQAARRDEVAMARFMIMGSLQIDPNLKGRQGMTPLQFAARSGKMKMLVSARQ